MTCPANDRSGCVANHPNECRACDWSATGEDGDRGREQRFDQAQHSEVVAKHTHVEVKAFREPLMVSCHLLVEYPRWSRTKCASDRSVALNATRGWAAQRGGQHDREERAVTEHSGWQELRHDRAATR